MKHKLLIVSSLLMIFCSIKGQAVMDAYKLSQTELTGTARFMSMGGAFGALGGDISAIAVNPAGIGVYKSSEIVATLNFQNMENKASKMDTNIKNNKFRVNFNNFAFVGTFPLYNDVAPLVNVGFSYNRLMNFDRRYNTPTGHSNHSLSDYIATRATDYGYTANNLAGEPMQDSSFDWMSIIGYNGGLITENTSKNFISSIPGTYIENDLQLRERGAVDSYDFNIGTTFEDMLSVGLKVSVIDLDYRMNSVYGEDIVNTKGDEGGFSLENGLKTEGVGWNLGLGVIFKPVQELRIGIAYHSPTWYNMTDYSYAIYDYNFNNIIGDMNLTDAQKQNLKPENSNEYSGYFDSGEYSSRWDYKLRTPDRWVFSLAGVLGKNAIISLDYELTDYKKTKFDERTFAADYTTDNNEIKDFHRLASTVRIGAEYRFTPQFSGRIGYSWQQSPYENSFKDGNYTVFTAGSVPQYMMYGDKHYMTWGLGYRFTKQFYADLGFVYRTQKSDLYEFAMADKTSHKENTFQGVLTLGFRFGGGSY